MTSVPEADSAAHRVYEWVRARVLDGTFPGGTMLSEGEVADAAGTSRTPVREAFLRLASQELLTLYPKRGALVLSVTPADLHDMITARSLIEPWAASVVAQLADRASVVAELRRLTDEATDALARGDDSAFQEADRAFHHRVLTAAGNRILTSFYSSLRDRQMRSGTLALRSNPQRGTETMAQHTAITDAIASGDAAHAAVVAAAHVDSTAAALGLSSAPSANSSNTGYRTDVR